ncbi:hypothetical protein C6376_28530 [Streptomyces sp. P3]|uniref:hypothetical protein n=1 Tax=Streptomyces sp. P3 TaxID=2135430 RepID=UPI000D19FE89|nr:hypothetical protein [Streptomyces sp. P3]AVV44771.1 hypothetical protein C6376_28530 [Streptomyces sp. P3]
MTSLPDLAPGTALRINSVEWTAEEVLPQVGQVVLSGGDGERQTRSIRWLMHHPHCRPAKSGHPSGRREGAQQPVTTRDLTEDQVKRARLRAAHVLEAETGYRSRHPSRALPGEPRPAYDPDRTTVTGVAGRRPLSWRHWAGRRPSCWAW